MKRVFFSLVQGFVGLCILALGAPSANAQSYTVMNLGNGWVDERLINASGQVAFYDSVAGYDRAFFFDGNTIHDLGTLGGAWSYPVAVSDTGQVVGYSLIAGNSSYHAFSWTAAGGMVDLGTLGGSWSYPQAVSDTGQVVGWSYTAGDTVQQAFSWTTAGGMVAVGTLGGNWAYPTAVTDTGQVVGYALLAGNSSYHAFSWTAAGGTVDLGTLGGSYSYPQAVNESGQVVGWAYTAGSSAQHAFSWTAAGGMVDLGTLGGSHSGATGVNESGQVVGWANTAGNSTSRAFAWTAAGGMVDLGTLGGSWSQPIAITDAGQVVGYSLIAGNSSYHAFSWTAAGGIVDIGTFGGPYSYPYGVSPSGQVVGSADGPSGPRAFSWTQPAGLIDLNAHIPSAPAGLELYYATAVSDNGKIVAYSNAGSVLLGGSSTAPVLGPIAATDPVAVSTPTDVGASFTDADATDTHTAEWTWGDGSPSSWGVVTEASGSGSVSGSHVFGAAGVYTVNLELTDSTGRTASSARQIVVYDPSAGFVTGGGWFHSPIGAYKADQTMAGRATFGFVSKYLRGATVPTGNTEFQFRAAGLNFHSNTYEWLVVAGARAQYKGTGTINGTGQYKFMLTAIDGQVSGGGGVDRFRIKIWYRDANLEADVVVYDNQTDAALEGTSSEGTLVDGGSIVIHRR
jgi:probable HAF family extracellular repeat protein